MSQSRIDTRNSRWVLEFDPLDDARSVREESQLALGRQLGIEQLEAAGRRVPRVRECFMPLAGPLGHEPGEVAVRDVRFAADLQHGRRLLGPQPQGQAANRAGVVGNLVAASAVTPCHRLREHAVFVGDGYRHSVDLVLDRVLDRLAVDEFANSRVELVERRLFVDIVD